MDTHKYEKEYNIYKQELKVWGKTHNLSALLDDKSIDDNIKDSIEPFALLKNKINKFKNFVDIGSGCGYPGIFIALHFPNTKAVLVEPRAKRAAFLSYVCIKMGLKNLKIKQESIQDMNNAKFDLILSRAFIDICSFVKLGEKLCKENSQILLYKGSSFKNELDELIKNNQNIKPIYKISKNNQNRNFVLLNSNIKECV
jgi:16S rRNA (guanine527-N7)-methyltransferase